MEQSKEIIDKKDNKIDLPKTINSEVNLLLFPFFALTKKSNKKMTKVEYKDITERNNKKIEILWQVSSNSEYGYPGLFDREVHKAIEQIVSETLKEKGEVKNPISFSIYDLCKRMGVSFKDGGNFRKVKKSLEKIRATTIKSEGALYYKKEKKWLSKVFGIYDGIVFRGDQLEGNITAETNYLYLSDIYLQSLNAYYIKPIDYTYLQSLESNIASRLYELLGVKFYGLRNKRKNRLCYRYSKLSQLLPVTPFKQLSRAKQQLDPAHNELKNTGFISQFKWSENGKDDWLIYYWPGERAKKEMKDNRVKQLEFDDNNYLNGSDISDEEVDIKKQTEPDHNHDLVDQLVDLNVSRITATRLVKNYNKEMIKGWVRAVDFSNAEDKAAYIVKAIKENWRLPEEYLREKEDTAQKEEQERIDSLHKKEQKKKGQKLQEEKQKLDQIYHSLDPDKQKEIDKEAENRLDDFWKSQLNKQRSKGKLLKILQAALDEKRREIVKEYNFKKLIF
ncbi:MAG: hypothetical protein PHD33_01185 [Atribacterota bacterium]|nr:hypothetical protein [Atribacterota bacterium]